jgi:hypothetical protein
MTPCLPAPQIVRCYFETSFTPHLPAMCLHWDDEISEQERLWELPEGITILGIPPRRFGVSILRQGEDSYEVRLLWDRSAFHWRFLPRAEVLTSSLAPLLSALGTEIWYLLEQPFPQEQRQPLIAA